MGIQSSINSLLSQAQSLAAFYRGFKKAGDLIKGQEDIVKGQKAQTEATENLQKTIEERYKEYKGIPSDVVLHPSQLKAVQEAEEILHKGGYALDPKTIDDIARRNAYMEQEASKPELKNEIASELARGSVRARTDSINQSKSNFDEHIASLIRYYGKGSGNP